MADEDAAEALAEDLAAASAALAVELHEAIAHLRRPGAFAPAGHPVAAVFDLPDGAARTRHRAGRPSDEVIAVALEARRRAAEALGYGAGEDNPALTALALGAFYAVEARRSDAFGLGALAREALRARPVTAEAARRDVAVEQGQAAVRVWAPVEGDDRGCVDIWFGRP